MTLFTQAREAISRSLIERILHSPGARWQNGEYWTRNPLRRDKNIGSFCCKENGQWFDHATKIGGDLIDLVAERDRISKKEAAEKIIELAGKTVEKKSKSKEKKRPAAQIPVPEEAFEKLNKQLQTSWSIEKNGPAVAGWRWRDARGAWCGTARHEKDGEKNVIPYYYTETGKWRQGNPLPDNRPIYREDELPGTDTPVLIVEGEKCAMVPVPGYFVTTWIGGTGQVQKTQWSVLKRHNVVIWPDNDSPGRKAAAYIKTQLPNAKILTITDKPDKWDIFNAQEEGVDLYEFIQEGVKNETDRSNPDDENETPRESLRGADDESDQALSETRGNKHTAYVPFIFLGYDERRHYFLPREARIVKYIGQGSWNKTKLLELAPLDWWQQNHWAKSGFNVDEAIDATIRASEKTGMFQPSRIRGTGVWMHDEKIVVNNGRCVTDEYGAPITPSEEYYYVRSDKRMVDFKGDASSVQEGLDLIDLFTSQGFETEFDGLALLGWTLISPFGGLLKWRPHIWLTGPSKSGKSFILENIIEPMINPFCHVGTGKTSPSGIYRSIRNTACPILLDEMEPGKNSNKDIIQKIEDKLELARNASSDFSATFTLTSMSGSGLAEEFCVRSCFLFASILPYFSGEAIESRIVISRLKNIKTTAKKIERTADILKRGVLVDPARYQRRIFRNLKTIIKNIEIAKKTLKEITGDQRKSDNLAPICAALVALVNDADVEESRIHKMIGSFAGDYTAERAHVEADEDKLLFEMLDYIIQIGPSERLSFAELIRDAAKLPNINSDKDPSHNILQRSGLRICEREAILYLAVAINHSAIKRILTDTMYAGNYTEILKRHEASRGTCVIRFAGQTKRAVLLDWDMVHRRYFEEREDDETGSLFVDHSTKVFL